MTLEDMPSVFRRSVTVCWVEPEFPRGKYRRYYLVCVKGATCRHDFNGLYGSVCDDVMVGFSRDELSGKVVVRLFCEKPEIDIVKLAGLFERLPPEQGAGFTCDEFPW